MANETPNTDKTIENPDVASDVAEAANDPTKIDTAGDAPSGSDKAEQATPDSGLDNDVVELDVADVAPDHIFGMIKSIADYSLSLANNPWTYYQLAVVGLLFFVSKLLSTRVEPRLEAWVRGIKGNPGLLRVLAALLRRVEWLLFIPLLWMTLQIFLSYTWPSRTYVLKAVLSLAAAWLIISVLSRIIRNRMISQWVRYGGWILVALHIVGWLESAMHTLDLIAISFGNFRLSPLTFLKGIITITALLWLATTFGNAVDTRLQKATELTPSLRVLFGKVIKISLVIIALALALSSIGVDLTALTVFSGAVGVGIGFGLQKVVSNFISGIIILLDKSIKPGDTISLGDTFGWIRELRARFVSVVTRDGREYLIPNEDFVTQQVVNWSFTDTLIRLDVPFGVSYDSDPHLISKIAIEATAKVDRVSGVRQPVCWITGFGDSSIDFLLRFWVNDPQNGLTNIRGKVMLALWDTFKEHEVEIPYPHREIIMRNAVQQPNDAASDIAGGELQDPPQGDEDVSKASGVKSAKLPKD